MQWNNTNSKKLFDAPPNELKNDQNLINDEDNNFNENENDIDTSNNINSWKDKNNLLDLNNINIDIEEKKQEKIINKKNVKNVHELLFDFDMESFEKDPKYNHSNINIIKNIDYLHKEINRLEFNFIDDKELILRNLRKDLL